MRQEGHPACKDWAVGAGMDRGADLHMAQLMPLPLTVFCFTKIQFGFTFLVPAHPGSPGQRAVKRVCVSVKWLAVKTASEMTYTVSGGALNSTQTKPKVMYQDSKPADGHSSVDRAWCK